MDFQLIHFFSLTDRAHFFLHFWKSAYKFLLVIFDE